jgi:hypothetical protein
MLGAFRGTAVHDHGKPSLTYNACDQALCHAHQRRARRFLHQQYQQLWANDRAALLLESTVAVEAPPAPAMSLAPPAPEACAQR